MLRCSLILMWTGSDCTSYIKIMAFQPKIFNKCHNFYNLNIQLSVHFKKKISDDEVFTLKLLDPNNYYFTLQ